MAHKITSPIPHKLITIVCTYYGLKSVKEPAESARSAWRYGVIEEARQVGCWMLQRHCDLSLEELQVALKQLQWNSLAIRVAVAQANRKLAQGDFAFRLAIENIEQMILATLICKK